MSAYNDRRTGKDRREGDRRWLGYLNSAAKSIDEKNAESALDEGRTGDRRIRGDRRDKNNPLSHISY